MNDVPDWLWQELAADAIWTSIAVGAAWTLRNRREIIAKLRSITRQPVYISAVGEGNGDAVATLTAGATLDAGWNNYQTTASSADLSWRVEAPTPSLARRLEELASWYLHVS
jgi:hypothetical protein